MISDAIALFELISKMRDRIETISAFFRWDGTRISGDEGIEVVKNDQEDGTWYYSIKEIDNYVFIRIPVNAGGVIEKIGSPAGENPDSKYFRYIGVPDGRIYGGVLSNVKVDFMVFGYKPEDLLRIQEERT